MNRPLQQWLVITQLFCLFLLLIMPLLIRWLSGWEGKVLYTAITAACLFLASRLREGLNGPH
jgi:hypothetical protein